MRLGPGEYFGEPLSQRRLGPALLVLSAYRPGPLQSWHVHSNPGFILLLDGDHCDHWRHERVAQSALSLIYHPTWEPHAGQVGPLGMLGLNIEIAQSWLDSLDLRERSLGGWQLLNSVEWRIRALRFLAFTGQFQTRLETDMETEALELLEPLLEVSRGIEQTRTPAWLRRAEELIRDLFQDPLTLRRIASEARVHPIYLARVFRRRHGCSVSEYIRALRLAHAGELILQQDCSVAESACAAGFCDQAHLARWFARAFGYSPKRLQQLRRLRPA